MKTPIDFGKEFLNKLYDQRDADACQKMLAGDLVWITPENMYHFLSEGAVLKYLRKQVKAETEARYVDLISIKSSPSADNIMTVAYEINLVSREEERPLYLRCSMVICRRSKRLEITFLHFSKKSERDSSEQLRAFITNLPCGVMILACLDGRREEAIFYNDYFAGRLRYKQEEFARAIAKNPFFMASEEDRTRVHEQIAQARKNGGSISANLRFYRRDGNSFYYRMKGAPAYQEDGGTVYYCVFQEITGFQMTTDRLQGRLDTATEILRQIPEAICGIEYPPDMMERKLNPSNDAADSAEKDAAGAAKKDAAYTVEKGAAGTVIIKEEASAEEGDGDVKIYRGRRGRDKGDKEDKENREDRSGGKTAAAAVKTPAVKISGTGPKVFFTSKNIPSMFGVSNSVYMKNILQDPFYGLEITSITRERLLSSFILNPDKAATGKAVPCGIFRIKKSGKEEEGIRVELVIRRVKDKDGTVRLYLFYYDREAAQQDLENRVDRAMKMGRAGQDQLRSDLRRTKENAARRQSELTASMKAAEEKHAADLTLVENNLAEEKKRGILMSRQLEEAKAAQKQLAAERDKIEEDASRRIRNHEARALRQVKEACGARDLMEEQLREAQERSRQLEKQLQKEKARRLLLEERYRQLQEQNDDLQKERKEKKESLQTAPLSIAESIGAALKSSTPAPSEKDLIRVAQANTQAGARTASSAGVSVGKGTETASDHVGSPVSSISSGSPVPSASSVSSVSSVPLVSAKPVFADVREGDWMTQAQTLTVFSSMNIVQKEKPDKEAAGVQIKQPAAIPADRREAAFSEEPEAIAADIREAASAEVPEAIAADSREAAFSEVPEAVPAEDRDEENIFGTSFTEKPVLKLTTFSPETFLRDIMIEEDAFCTDKNITLRLFRDSSLPSEVSGFASLLRSALCEILENSISRTRPGGIISVHCRADRPSGGLVNLYFRIDDNGTRIPAEGMQSIFGTQNEENADASVRPVLSAAQEAAALMGGSLHAGMIPGGTRFSLTVALRV